MGRWIKKSNLAEYEGANWDNEVMRHSGLTPEQAMELGDSNPHVTFFFYCREPIYLSKGAFSAGDAVYFSGKP